MTEGPVRSPWIGAVPVLLFLCGCGPSDPEDPWMVPLIAWVIAVFGSLGVSWWLHRPDEPLDAGEEQGWGER